MPLPLVRLCHVGQTDGGRCTAPSDSVSCGLFANFRDGTVNVGMWALVGRIYGRPFAEWSDSTNKNVILWCAINYDEKPCYMATGVYGPRGRFRSQCHLYLQGRTFDISSYVSENMYMYMHMLVCVYSRDPLVYT